MSSIPQSLDPAQIRDEHRVLYRQALDSRAQIGSDPNTRARLHGQVEHLMEELRALSDRVSSRGDWAGFVWLQAAATDWQQAFDSVFHETRNVRAELKVPAVPPPAEVGARRAVIPYQDILNGIRKTAYSIGLARKEQVIRARIRELEDIRDDRGRIHRVLPSSPEERDEDWRLSMVHFAADVLGLRTNFVYQLEGHSWIELARVPLDDVKQVDAYYAWEEDAQSDPVKCYLQACDQLRTALLSPQSKALATDFQPLRAFLWHSESPATSKVLREKARLRWRDRTRRGQPGDANADWYDAGAHMELFYGNVVDAIEGSGAKQQTCMRLALTALRSPWREQGLVTCLDAAIAIYFFAPELVKGCSENPLDLL